MNKTSSRYLAPLIIFFVASSGFFVAGKQFLAKKNIDQEVAIVGNLILFIITLTATFISIKGATAVKPQAAVRSMYGSFMIKFFLIAIAAFVYILIAKKNVNKPALILCAGLYIVYTFIEVRVLMRMLKEQKNA